MSAPDTKPTKRRPTLSPEQWFVAAQGILVAEGMEAIRIDRLCQTLDVTKGSFYWHFTNRAAFLAAFLHHWRDGATLSVIENLSGQGLDAGTRLQTLLTLPQRPRAPAAALVEQSIRSWARQDQQAQDALNDVDQIRQSFIQHMLEELGFAPAEAIERARMAYAFMLGDAILSRGETDTVERPMQDALLALFTRPLQPK